MSRFIRKLNIRNPKKVIRIYTEGEKTEPNYFNAIKNELRLNEIDIKVHGMGYNTMPLVEFVIVEKNGVKGVDEDTEWWVVFDKDNFSIFDHAIEKAMSEGINVAYSNECFELWFILHFELLNTAIGRQKYYEKLTNLLSQKYDKNISGIYNFIKDKEKTAIRNAKKLEEEHDSEGSISFSKRDPSTSVYKLVEQLRALKVDL